MRQEYTFEGCPVGIETEPIEEVLSRETVLWYAHALDTPNDDWYRYGSPLGEPIVPPAVLRTVGMGMRTIRISAPGGNVNAGTAVEYKKPVKVGTKISARGKLTEKYEKRGKYYTVWEFTVRDEGGDEVMVIRHLQCALPAGQKVQYR
jgi:acyl dehydratase